MIETWKNKWLSTPEMLFCLVLTGMVLFNFSLTALRIYHTQQLFFLFLVWNLFLALLPWVGVMTARYLQQQGVHGVGVGLFLGLTILFLPNAPYLMTDLCHLRWSSYSNILWLDTLMIVAYTITGLVGFYATLFVLEQLLEHYFSKLWTNVALVILFFLTGYGIYLGRFLRFNSWDLWINPWSLVEVMTESLLHPTAHPRTWGVTIGYGGLFLLGFYGLKLWKYSLIKYQITPTEETEEGCLMTP